MIAGGRSVTPLTPQERAELDRFNDRLRWRYEVRPAPHVAPGAVWWTAVAVGEPKQFTRAYRQRMRGLQKRFSLWRWAQTLFAQGAQAGTVTTFPDGSALVIPEASLVPERYTSGDQDLLDELMAALVDPTPSRHPEH